MTGRDLQEWLGFKAINIVTLVPFFQHRRGYGFAPFLSCATTTKSLVVPTITEGT